MKIYLNEITDKENDVHLSDTEVWVQELLTRVCEPHQDEPPSAVPSRGRLEGSLSLKKVDGVVVARGSMLAGVPLLCSRCAKPFVFQSSPKFLALYSNDPEMTGVDQVRGQSQGHQVFNKNSKQSHDSNRVSEEIEDPTLDITYLTDDFIDIGEVVSEQIQLQIPFQPLCKSDCMGLCQTCGLDLNSGHCACEKIVNNRAFSGTQLSSNQLKRMLNSSDF